MEDMAKTLTEIVTSTANTISLDNLKYDDKKGTYIDHSDLRNVIEMFDAIVNQSTALPPAAGETFSAAAVALKERAAGLAGKNLTDPANQIQAYDVSSGAMGIIFSLDFFNPNYPEGEAFVDQTFSENYTPVESELVNVSAFPDETANQTVGGSPSKQGTSAAVSTKYTDWWLATLRALAMLLV